MIVPAPSHRSIRARHCKGRKMKTNGALNLDCRVHSFAQRPTVLGLAACLLLLGLRAGAGTRADPVAPVAVEAHASAAAAQDSMWDLSELYATPQAWADAYTRE